MSRSSRWTAQQLLAIAAVRQAATAPPRYNPRPSGVIRDGSATDAVLALLRAQPRRWWRHCDIVSATGRPYKAVNWACLYLRNRGLVEIVSDEARNARYLRYRLAPANHSHPRP